MHEDKFDYSSTALDPKLDAKVVKRQNKVQSGKGDKIWIHLANILATHMKPFLLYVDGHLVHTGRESMPMNRLATLEVELENPKDVVEVRVKILYDGFDATQKFDIKNQGQHIRIAVIDDRLQIAQRVDDKFP